MRVDNKTIEIHNLYKKYNGKLLNIKTPIIGVFNSSEFCDTHCMIQNLYCTFKNKGYKPCIIAKDNIIRNNNGFEFPENIFKCYSDYDQVILFNNYIYEISKVDNPDLFIIHVPQGIAPLSKELDNNFGIQTYKIANSLNFDFAILNMYFDFYSDDFFEKIEKVFEYKFSISKLYINIILNKLDWLRIRTEKIIKLMDIDEVIALNHIDTLNKSNIICHERNIGFNFMINEMENLMSDSASSYLL